MILVTGGAGFIGSNLVAALEAAGEDEIVVCDRLRDGAKWRNIAKRTLRDVIHPDALLDTIAGQARHISQIFHMGAISSTTATDGDAVVQTNFALSVSLWRACAEHGIGFIYASSAATYGAGERGFADDNDLARMRCLRPLNLYGWSKWLFDCWVMRTLGRGDPAPPAWAGLRFFNVYGPNEYHKGAMRSLVCKIIDDHRPGQPVKLFKSCREDIADGQQSRDFIHVDDAVAVMMWLKGLSSPAGIINVGTGTARSFADLAGAAISAVGEAPVIAFVDMPEALRENYQYHTCADMRRLRSLGYGTPFMPIEEGVRRYVQDYLLAGDRFR